MKKKIVKASGITLIALVVTIVVLLILAGITISLVFSDNGIIKKAQEASKRTNQGLINEQIQINEAADYMGNMLDKVGGGSANEDPTANWDLSKVEKVTSADGVVVPVPKGYTASSIDTENTVEDGFVIYEGEENVNDTNKDIAQTTRNQFVWVPVANPSEMYGIDENHKKLSKLYNFSSSGITPLNWTEENNIMKITVTSGSESYREPEVVTGEDGNECDADSTNLQQAGLDLDATSDIFKAQLESEFNNMIESVEKYGGFYIGRYETGDLSQEEAVVVKNNSDVGNQTWYTMYSKAKKIALNSNVRSTMIWGSQWDAVMRWMYNSGNEEKQKYTYDSTGKGNYNGTNGNQLIATGSNENYKVNNIYDMAGNVFDWTIEIDNNNYRVNRGGNWSYDGNYLPAFKRSLYIPTDKIPSGGCRVTLYM